MSFGFGIGDFIAVIELANKLRKDFSTAPKQYNEIAEDVKSLSLILQEVDTSVAGIELSQAKENNLCEIGGRCKKVLEDVNRALDKYSSLNTHQGIPNDRSLGKRIRRVWQRINFEPEEFREYRSIIALNISMLDTFLNGIITRDGIVKLIQTQEHQENQAILEWLSTADYQTQQARNIGQRLENTGQWLLESPEYKRWTSSSKEVLFLHGIAGAGKTVLSSIVIKHLQKICYKDEKSGLLYFYCNYRQRETQQIDTIMLTWLRQLAERSVNLPQQIKDLYNRYQKSKERPKLEEIKAIVYNIAGSLTKLYIVVDALDECHTSNGCQKQLINEIIHLSRTIGACAVATSRPLSHIEAMFEGCTSAEIRAATEDIRNYIDVNMADLPNFVIDSSELQEEVRVNIVESSDRLFLLVKLNIEALKGITTKKKFRTALRELAHHKGDYAEAYEKTMVLINSQREGEKDQALKVLAWIVLARRPLTVLELSHALAIEPEDTTLDEENIPELSSIISVCKGLVTVVAETGIVQLIHFTTQEFFKGTGLRWVQPFEVDITNACLSYLSLSEFDTGACNSEGEFRLRLKNSAFYEYASRYWGFHARFKVDLAIVHGFFNHEKRMTASSQVITPGEEWYNWKKFHGTTLWTPAHFVAYFGLENWLEYVSKLSKIDSVDYLQRSALSYASRYGHEAVVRSLVEKGAQLDLADSDGDTALVYASENGHEAVVRLLLETGAQLDIANEYGNTALMRASESGHEAVVRLLVEKGAQLDLASWNGNTAFIYASRSGHEAVVRLLVEKGAQLDLVDKNGWTALMRASESGHEAVVRLLVEKGAQLDLASEYGNTALMSASGYGYEAVVRLLVEKGAQLDLAGWNGNTALIYASRSGHEAVVRLLVEKGAQLDLVDEYGKTALMRASESGHKAVVRLLVEKGAQLDLADEHGNTALICASRYGYEAVVRLLVEKGAQLDLVDKNGWTALMRASESGHEAVVRLLVEKGAQLDLASEYGNTALMYASRNGHEAIVRLLVEKGAQLDIADEDGNTALMYASRNGHEAIVRLLVEKGAQLDIADSDGNIALMIASESGHEAVVRLLAEQGAEPE